MAKLQSFVADTPVLGIEADVRDDPYTNLDQYVIAACNESMPRKRYHGIKKPMYWWTAEIVELRKTSLAARRIYQRARKRRGAEQC